MIQAISDEDFRKLTNFIKSQYGITLQQKRQLVTSRLSSLLMEQGYNSFSEFVDHFLKEKDPQKIEQVQPSDHKLHLFYAGTGAF